ncbi:MAG: hypothetical protein N2Z82_09085 [Thermomicrobium sp.]|nr:hypothetical protein [Thermomicrobium sp.]
MGDHGQFVILGHAFAMGLWLRQRGSERPGMLREIMEAGERWRARQQHLDLARIVRQVDPSLVDPVTQMPRGDFFRLYQERFGIHFFQDLIDQLAPLSETQAAIALVSALGLEPWYVWAQIVPKRVQRDPADPLDIEVPRTAIGRMGDWALGLQVIDIVGKQLFELSPDEEMPSPRELAVWPIMLALRHRIPHALALPEAARDEFVAAVDSWEAGENTDGFLIERMSLAWVDRFGEPRRSPVRARKPGPWHPWHFPEALDPADAVLWNLLRVAVGLVEGWRRDVPEVLAGDELRAAWDGARAALDGLLATRYARQVARSLGITWAITGSLPEPAAETAWRLLLLEGILRELAGAVRAMVLESEEWLERYGDLHAEFQRWARDGFEEFGR